MYPPQSTRRMEKRDEDSRIARGKGESRPPSTREACDCGSARPCVRVGSVCASVLLLYRPFYPINRVEAKTSVRGEGGRRSTHTCHTKAQPHVHPARNARGWENVPEKGQSRCSVLEHPCQCPRSVGFYSPSKRVRAYIDTGRYVCVCVCVCARERTSGEPSLPLQPSRSTRAAPGIVKTTAALSVDAAKEKSDEQQAADGERARPRDPSLPPREKGERERQEGSARRPQRQGRSTRWRHTRRCVAAATPLPLGLR